MSDTVTRNTLSVSTNGAAAPYIRVPVSQLDDIRQLLEKNNIHYRVHENVISLNGGPEIAVVDFGRGADIDAVRRVLDSVH